MKKAEFKKFTIMVMESLIKLRSEFLDHQLSVLKMSKVVQAQGKTIALLEERVKQLRAKKIKVVRSK